MRNKKLYMAMIATVSAMPLYFAQSQAFADNEQNSQLILVTENNYADNYHYADETRKQTTSIMLFGVTGAPQAKTTRIPHYTPDLTQFIDNHLKSVKNGLLSQFSSDEFDLYAGDNSFFSDDINRGLSTKSAKLAGIAKDFGRWTVGGGYTWGEQNPAFLNENEEGYILGASYSQDDWAIQASYMATGNAFKLNRDDEYNSLVLGVSYAPRTHVGYSATVQFQEYNGDKTYIDDQDIRFTIGTKIKF